jgi:uncharacterized protein (DUF1501 family)
MSHQVSRRDFMGQASCAAVGSSALASTLLSLLLTSSASAQVASKSAQYKAIVCLFLPGGNDSFNLLVPNGVAEHAEYAAVRGDLALARNTLLPLSPLNNPGRDLALHPAVPELQQLFQDGKLAMVANVGSLVKPTTLADFNNGTALPYGLFSHSDQQEQWQTSIPDERAGIGWGGRIADLLYPQNRDTPVSMNISISGNNLFQVGQQVIPYSVNADGALALRQYNEGGTLSGITTEAIDSLLAEEYTNVLEGTFNRMKRTSRDAFELFTAATATGLPAGTVFPQTGLGRSLEQVAKVIAGRTALGVRRQVFYVQWGGWDFHDNVINNMQNMLPVVSKAVKAFYDAMVAMGLGNNVTLFTASDFGRSLTSNAQGSDHAWGGNHFVVGGAVQGRKIYGQYPDLYLDNPLDTGRGNLIPTTSVDQYAAELAMWLGVGRENLPYVFPNLDRFWDLNSPTAPLGFMG